MAKATCSRVWPFSTVSASVEVPVGPLHLACDLGGVDLHRMNASLLPISFLQRLLLRIPFRLHLHLPPHRPPPSPARALLLACSCPPTPPRPHRLRPHRHRLDNACPQASAATPRRSPSSYRRHYPRPHPPPAQMAVQLRRNALGLQEAWD